MPIKSERTKVNCLQCGKEMFLTAYELTKRKCCSRKCTNTLKTIEKIKSNCLQCGKEMELYPKTIEQGKGKFCSNSCTTTYRNLRDNPASKPKVREKISKNHADFSGSKNPMYGKREKLSPNWKGDNSKNYRNIAFRYKERKCELCGNTPKESHKLHVHHKDRDRDNNEISNLQVLCDKCHLTLHWEEEWVFEMQRDKLGKFKKK